MDHLQDKKDSCPARVKVVRALMQSSVNTTSRVLKSRSGQRPLLDLSASSRFDLVPVRQFRHRWDAVRVHGRGAAPQGCAKADDHSCGDCTYEVSLVRSFLAASHAHLSPNTSPLHTL